MGLSLPGYLKKAVRLVWSQPSVKSGPPSLPDAELKTELCPDSAPLPTALCWLSKFCSRIKSSAKAGAPFLWLRARQSGRAVGRQGPTLSDCSGRALLYISLILQYSNTRRRRRVRRVVFSVREM